MSSIEELRYHLVFATKYRYNIISVKIAILLKNYFLKQQEKLGFQIISLVIESNHVHILFQLNSSIQDHIEIIEKIKRGSSFLARKKFSILKRYTALWTPSHFVASVGNVSKETIQNYINSQGIEDEVIQRTFKYKILTPTKNKLEKLRTYFQECSSKSRNVTPSSIYQDFEFHKVCCQDNELNLYIRQQNSKIEKQDTKLAKYWIKIPGSRTANIFWLGLQGRDIPEDAILKDSLIQEKKGVLYLNLVIEQKRIIQRVNPRNLLSLDLGINHPIASVILEDGHMSDYKFYGSELKNLLFRREKRHAQLQHSGIEEPKSSHTSKINNLLHQYTNEIIKIAKENNLSIVVGNLTGIRKNFTVDKSNRNTRKKVNRTPFFKIKMLLEYKARLAGIPLVFVNEAYTSQRCNKCGEVNKDSRKGERFECVSCGHKNQADLNGALNIGSLVGLLSSSHSTLREEFSSESKPMALAMGK